MIAASLLHGLRSDRRIAAVMLPFCLLAISCDDGSVQSPPCTGESCRGDASPDADATALTDAPLGPEAEASVGVEAARRRPTREMLQRTLRPAGRGPTVRSALT